MTTTNFNENSITLSIVVLSHNRLEEIVLNLPTYTNISKKYGFELIVVDNASNDGSIEFLTEFRTRNPFVTVFFNVENSGVAEGRNIGGRISRGKHILFLDDDSRIDEESILVMARYMQRNLNTGVVSPRIVHAHTGKCQNEHGPTECEVGNYHGACHMVSGNIYRSLGGIDSLCNFGGEELDLSIRMRAAGFNVMYFPGVVVRHNNFVRLGDLGQWRRQRRAFNLCRIHFKYFPVRYAILLSVRYLISQIYSGLAIFGLKGFYKIGWNGLLGIRSGFRNRVQIQKPVVQFYMSSHIRPDFGNVSLWQKFFVKIKVLKKHRV